VRIAASAYAARQPKPSAVSPPLLVGLLAAFVTVVAVAIGPRAAAISAPIAVFGVGYHKRYLKWRNLLATLICVVLFVPIGRYTLPGNLPFQMDPYRMFALVLLLMWTSSLLVDRRVRASAGALGGPLGLIVTTILLSDIVNPGRVHFAGSVTIKRISFLLSFAFLYFVIVSLVKTAKDLDFLIRVLVAGGAVLGCFALLEYVSGYNIFNDFARFVPLRAEAIPYSLHRGGDRLRVFASSQHPIALGAMFVMLLPLAGYLWTATRKRRWLVAMVLVLMGSFATQSRTAIIMLLITFLVVLRYRASTIKRFWPILLPALLAIHIALPGSLGSLKNAFFPKGGVIAQQESGAGTYGSGRLADVGPTLSEYAQNPLLGEGYGTRITDKGPQQNANILDDQWLGTLVETGAAGTIAWLWLFGRFFRRLGKITKTDRSPRGWLALALQAGSLAFAVGSLTYDAFSFAQVTIVFFMLIGIGSVLLALPREQPTLTAAQP
jgi:O-antigen ligase/polysaccharide polymerase Wzy-like membrane protein